MTKTVHPDGLPTPQRYWSMAAIGVGIAMSVLDSAVANIALPTIARELQTTPAGSVWIINAYQLATVVCLLPLAALGDRIGYRRVYIAGLATFTVGSLACALSHTLTALVLSRVVQGLGAAGIMSMNGALVRFTYPQGLLGRGVGLNALVVSAAAALGPTIASGILAVASWEWLFAVNVPIGILNLVIGWRALPYSECSKRPFEWLSAGLNALVFGLFFVGVESFAHGGGEAVTAFFAIAAAIVAGIVLIRRERRVHQPMIPIDLMKIPMFAWSVATSICSFTAYMLAFVALPFYFETVLHRDQVQTGLLMTPWPVALGLAAPIAGRLADRIPTAILSSAGLGAMVVGLLALVVMPVDASIPDIIWRTALCGFGFGFFQAPNNRTMLSSAPRQRAGAAGGMLATARLTGQTAGASVAALVFRLAPGFPETVDLLVAAGFAVAAVVASLSRLATAEPTSAVPTGREAR